MSEIDEGGSRSGRSGGKTLSLKRTETSTVRQSFSHGRTKAVVVEKKRARVGTGKASEAEKPARATPADETPAARETREAAPASRASTRGGVVLRELTDE